MKSTILIIDDNEMMRSFLQHILGSTFEVVAAGSGEEAIRLLQDKRVAPELILSDFDLDGMSGLDLLTYIKSSTLFRHIPVVILSGKGNSNSRTNCLKAGASDFIAKPFNPAGLQMKIQEVLESSNVQPTAS